METQPTPMPCSPNYQPSIFPKRTSLPSLVWTTTEPRLPLLLAWRSMSLKSTMSSSGVTTLPLSILHSFILYYYYHCRISFSIASPLSFFNSFHSYLTYPRYPDVSHAYVSDYPNKGDKTPVAAAVKDEAWLQGEFIKLVQQRGAAVIKLRKLSSAASAAKAIIDHARDWVLGTPEVYSLSLSLFSFSLFLSLLPLLFSPVSSSLSASLFSFIALFSFSSLSYSLLYVLASSFSHTLIHTMCRESLCPWPCIPTDHTEWRRDWSTPSPSPPRTASTPSSRISPSVTSAGLSLSFFFFHFFFFFLFFLFSFFLFSFFLFSCCSFLLVSNWFFRNLLKVTEDELVSEKETAVQFLA